MTQNQKIHEHADYLLYLWYGMMFFTIIISAAFQYQLATTPLQKFVGIGLGILFPLVTSALLTSSIILFFLKFRVWGVGVIIVFIAAFVWEGHGHFSFWSEAMESKAETSKVSQVLTQQLEIVQEKLDALPVSGAVFSDSLDDEIAVTEKALSLCPLGHATVCINPAQAKLDRLYAKRDKQGVMAQVKAKRAELLSEKQRLLSSMAGTDEETESAKALSVFKSVSRFFYKDIGKAKYIESVAYFAFSVLCTVVASGLLGVRAKLRGLNYDSPAPQVTRRTESHKTQVHPKSFSDHFKNGDAYLRSAVYGASQKPAGTVAYSVDTMPVSDTAKRTPLDTDTQIQRGKYDFKEYANDKANSDTEESHDYEGHGIGFSAPIVSDKAVSEPDNRILLDTDTNIKSVSNGSGRKATDVVLAESIVKSAVLDGSFYGSERKVGTKSVMRFTRLHEAGVGQDNANLIIANLIDLGILDANGNKKAVT